MRILQVNKFYYRRAGAEAYMLDLESALKDAGHDVAVFASAHPENLATPWSAYFPPYHPFDRSEGLANDLRKIRDMIWSRDAARGFRKLLADFSPDVVHIHNIYHHLSPSIIRECTKRKIPVVQTLHDFKWICPNYSLFTHDGKCERCHVYRYWQAIANKCVQGSRSASVAAAIEMATHRFLKIYEKEVARFITPSSFLRETLIRWGKSAEKIVHIPNMVDLAHLPEARPETGDAFVFVGRLEEWKGARLLLEFAQALPDVPFTVLGSGPLELTLRQRVDELHLRNITFRGFVSREEVYETMRTARAVLVPSIGYDPFPTVALEAGMLGKAVIASRIGGIPEIVRDGETGILVTAGDVAGFTKAIRSLADDPAHATQLGAMAMPHVRALVDPATHLNRLFTIYDEVISRAK